MGNSRCAGQPDEWNIMHGNPNGGQVMISVLCVDDEREILQLEKISLEKGGEFQVDTAVSASEALGAFQNKFYDAVVADYSMPETDGIEFLRKIRSFTGVPFILFTGRGHEEVAVQAINNGVDYYVQKGPDSDHAFAELASRIREAVKFHREEELLKESEKKFRIFADNTSAWEYWEASDNHYIYMSPACTQITGYTAEEFYLDPGLINRIVLADDRNLWEHHRSESENIGINSSVEFRILTKNGEIRWISHHCQKIFGADGKSMGRRVTNVDITDRTANGGARIDDKERLRLLYDQIPLPYQSLDARGVFLMVNQTWLKTMGFTREEVIGHPFAEFLVPDHTERFHQMFARFIEKGEIHGIQFGMVKKDKSSILVEFTGRIASDEQGNFRQTHCIFTNITEREQMQRTIAENEVRLQSIIRVAPVGIGIVANRVFLEVNNRICQMTGYSREELVGRSARILYPNKEEFEFVGKEKYNQIAEDGSGSVETRWQKKTGEILDILLSSTPLDTADLSRGVTFTALDITSRKQAENAVQDSERRFRAIFEKGPVGMALADISFRFTLVNPKLCSLLGYSEQELVGKTFSEIVHPGFIEEDAETVQKLIKGEIPQYSTEKMFFSKNGNAIWGNFVLSIMRDDSGNILHILAIIKDISRRKNAEQALIRSEEKYRDLVEHASIIIMKTDTEGNITFLNEYAQRFFGFSEQEILGKSLLGTLVPETESVTSRDMTFVIHDAIAHPEKYATHENENLRRNGERVWIAWKNRPIYDEKGKITGLISFGTDMTERRKAEEALSQANKKLNLLNSITRHDILNQLTALFGYLEISKDLHPDEKTLSYIEREIKVTKTIRRMITFTKDYQDIGLYRPQWQNVGGMVRLLARGVELGKVNLIINLYSLEIFADPLLEKVFYTLIDNSLRHGGSKLSAIRFSYQISPKGCTLICEDDGDGVRYEEREKIFQKGYGKHTGFGLFLSREILGITGFTIEEKGKPGLGARFEIFIPTGSFRLEDDGL
jgi:PAS domain S-box-containing protein